MNRTQIIERFREDNPEITTRVITDAILQAWLKIGNLEFACAARLISTVTTFSAEVDVAEYDLTTRVTNFFDIDEMPGGGIAFNDKRLTFTTRAELDQRTRSWRGYSSGTPRKYYRRNQYFYFERDPSVASDITIDAIIKPDSFDDDSKTPFNELTYLEPFHYGLVLYLTMRAKSKVGKLEEFQAAFAEYSAYAKATKKTVQGGKIGKIRITPYQHEPTSLYR